MLRYIVRRIILAIPVLLLVSLTIFSLIHIAPGDPLTALLGQDGGDPEVIAVLEKRLGLDRPVPVQYLIWLGNAVRGDLGYSYHSRQSVANSIFERLPVTIQLCAMTVLISMIFAIPLGVYAAIRRGSWIDLVTGAGSALGASMPSFWLGILLILVFAVNLKWLPAYGYVKPTDDLVGNLKSLLLPSIALATSYTAVLSRLVRGSMLEILNEDYIRTARSKGLKENVVILRHGLRSALVPIVTVIGMETGRLLGGAVVTETVFALPGIGRLAVNAVLSRDFPTIQGVTLFMALMLLLSNLVADLLYGVVDPRIRYS